MGLVGRGRADGGVMERQLGQKLGTEVETKEDRVQEHMLGELCGVGISCSKLPNPPKLRPRSSKESK